MLSLHGLVFSLFIYYEIVHEVQEQTERNKQKSNTYNQDNPAHTLENIQPR